MFAVTFFVGAFLAGMGGVMVASFAGVATGADGQWLLHSLVVVIIGGLGSIKGAVAGSLLYGMVTAFAPVYLPSDYTYYSIIFSFALLAIVLAVRPVRPVRTAGFGVNVRGARTRTVVVGVAVALLLVLPLVGTEFFVNFVLTRTLIFGLAASSIVFLSSYVGMVSLAQYLLVGVASFTIGNCVAESGKGLKLGLDPWLAVRHRPRDLHAGGVRPRRPRPAARRASTSSCSR